MDDQDGLRVIWSDRSRSDLENISIYIARFAPMAAQRFTTRLVKVVESLSQQPDRGKPVGRGLRELVIISPYRVRYRVTPGRVDILRIKHMARRQG